MCKRIKKGSATLCVKSADAGFSLIEVLVASTILLMIMMMLGMLFQQSSQAWRTGTRRADMYEQIRGYFGAIQRDAAAAVDEKTIPQRLRTLLGGNQNFSGQLQFYTLSGSGFYNNQVSSQNPRRSLTFVTYSGLNRREQRLCVTGTESVNATIASDISVGTIQPFSWNGNGVSGSDFPAFITVKAAVNPRRGKTMEIGAGSAGPDMQWNSKDDIVTWVD